MMIVTTRGAGKALSSRPPCGEVAPVRPVGPLQLQGDHGPVAYRNIYWRPLRPLIHR